MLPSERNTQATDRKIRRAARALGHHVKDTIFEHGHWWIETTDGAQYDAVDAIGPNSVDGFAFECVTKARD